jgi:hypothetical protein
MKLIKFNILVILFALAAFGQATNYGQLGWDLGTTTPGYCTAPTWFYNTAEHSEYTCVSHAFVAVTQFYPVAVLPTTTTGTSRLVRLTTNNTFWQGDGLTWLPFGGVKSSGPSISGCGATLFTGSSDLVGTFESFTAGTCTVAFTFGNTYYGNGTVCLAMDRTTPADVITAGSPGLAGVTFSGTTSSGDLIDYLCRTY